ncbi:DUF6153 family protein [Micromonospora andamanensis]|uniref:Uncharacterized protein n=1 Tax=Micromonospora andamanensis TaxID=1287068 RepID=A0ABQ4HTG5_9ACTN|nr:DUF6153 family protein [Micromonospora andamanensis]GIJ08900.1 hypothetical protein Van01_21140 [Micromonospora andamanensis]
MRGEAATTGRWLRFVLLACTLFGLAAMHSLGHDPVLGTAGHGGHAAPISSAHLDGCHDERCVAPAAQTTEEPGHGHPSGWSVCLAIAAGLALAAVLAAHHLRRTRSVRPPDRRLTRARGGRAPPAFPMIGLTTASVSVLRT